MERVDLTTLWLFRAVAEEGNIGRAADREHIVASAISKRIQDLEQEFGTPLLKRHPKGVELTAAGQALYLHSQNAFAVLRRMRDEMQEFATGLKGHIRLSANSSAVVQFLPDVLRRFLPRHPQVQVRLSEELSETTVRLVRDGAMDMGIVTAIPLVRTLETIPFRSDRICLAVRSDHPLADREVVAFEETLVYDHVGLEERSAVQDLVIAAAEARGRPLRLKVRVASFDALRYMVRSGIGIGFLPEECIRPYEQAMRLRTIGISDSWTTRELVICVRERAALSLTAQALLAELTR